MSGFLKTVVLTFLLAVAACAAWGQRLKCSPGMAPGWWSTDASDLCPEFDGKDFRRDMKIYSPDSLKVVRVVNEKWWLEIGSQKLSLTSRKSALSDYPVEVAWAPDSQRFYITQSDGSIAGFHTEVYQIDKNKIQVIPHFNQKIQRDFARNHKCVFFDKGADIGDEPNIAGLKWLSGSSQLLVVAEVAPHSLCEHMGYFAGYLVSIPKARIVERFSPEEINKQWGDVLGYRLKNDFQNLSVVERTTKP